MDIYCISGLGADRRAFQFLEINNKLIHIEWLTPIKNESLSDYSKRLSKQINTKEPFVLLGLSFGGIVACKIATFLKPEKVILLSSITDKKHLPLVLRLIGKTGIHKIVPAAWLNPPMNIAYWFFGVKKEKSKQLLKEIFTATDQQFLKWAIGILLNNEGIIAPENVIRIHGTNDRLLPLVNRAGVHKVEGGGHFMVIEQAAEVSEKINRLF